MAGEVVLTPSDILGLTESMNQAKVYLDGWSTALQHLNQGVNPAKIRKLHVGIWEFRQLLTDTLRKMTLMELAVDHRVQAAAKRDKGVTP